MKSTESTMIEAVRFRIGDVKAEYIDDETIRSMIAITNQELDQAALIALSYIITSLENQKDKQSEYQSFINRLKVLQSRLTNNSSSTIQRQENHPPIDQPASGKQAYDT